MRNAQRVFIILGLCLGTLCSGAFADDDDDDVKNGSVSVGLTAKKRDYVQLAKVSLEQAIRKALKEVPGKAVEAELDREDGFLVYKVKVVAPDKKVTELKIDAGNEKVLVKKSEGKFWD